VVATRKNREINLANCFNCRIFSF